MNKINQHVIIQTLKNAIIAVICLHIFWNIVAYLVGSDNRVTTDLAGRFGLDGELSVPTWLTAVMALMVAGLAWLIAEAHQTFSQKGAWYLIAVGAVFVSLDEVAALHELTLQGFHILGRFGEGQTYLYNAWILVLPFILLALAVVLRILRNKLPRDTYKNLLIAVGVYFMGALVVEYISIPFDRSAILYKLLPVVIEEGLELVGILLIIRGLLIHIKEHEPKLKQNLKRLINA